MKLALLKEIHEILPNSGIGHFIFEHADFIQKVLDEVKPKNIWEFGFNTGHSASLWLTLSDATVYSVDPSTLPETREAVSILTDRFPDRLKYFPLSSTYFIVEECMRIYKPDLLLIDGDHSYEGCYADLSLAARLQIPHLVIDNLEDTHKVARAFRDFLTQNKDYELVKEVTVGGIITGYVTKVR